MIKSLIKHGNSVALIIDRPILAMLGMRPKSKVDLRTDGKVLVVAPCDELETKLAEALDDEKKRNRALKALME